MAHSKQDKEKEIDRLIERVSKARDLIQETDSKVKRLDASIQKKIESIVENNSSSEQLGQTDA
jgi:hypothetical protein